MTSICHAEIVDAHGDPDACNKPATGHTTGYDPITGGTITYPACNQHQGDADVPPTT